MKSQETNKIYKPFKKKKQKSGDQFREMKNLRIKLKKLFQFEVIFSNKSGTESEKKISSMVAMFFSMDNMKTKAYER
jgi:hypothetical protein